MAISKRTFRMFVEEELGEFPHFLVWAVLEWILIISLYLDGFLTCISNKFADVFELDPPCVLCTRVDHALSGKNPNAYYNESICDAHKKDISSLAFCHVHRKISDIRHMCEACLLSLATEKDSDADANKQKDGDFRTEDDHKVSTKPDKKATDGNEVRDANRCLCCGEPLRPTNAPSKGYSTSVSNVRASSLATSSPRASSSLFPTSSPRASSLFPASSPRTPLFPTSSPRASLLYPTSSPRAASLFPTSSPRASSSLFPTSSPRAFSSLAPICSPRAPWRIDDKNAELPPTRYTELKFVSDNEPDMPDDDYGLNTDTKQVKQDAKSATMPLIPDSEEMNEECNKTPSFIRGNKFFGIPLDSVAGSPRWANKPPKKVPVEKSDLLSENIDEAPADGDSILQQLKKQVSENRKAFIAMYMELDEERSAAAVAANNAMAMITRLQAEKAAVQMEALQYQRMMEEQAEYDQEAIQILKDLLVKKEEDVKVLEAELEAYRERYEDLSKLSSDEYEIDVNESYQGFKTRSLSSFGDKSEGGSPREDHNGDGEGQSGRSGETGRGNHEGSPLNFETERSQLFGMLKNLENHVHPSSHEEDHQDKDMGEGNKATFTREVSLMREKLKAIEAESGFLKHTAMTLQKGDEGAKLLTEIAEHLRKLHSSEKPDDTNTTET